MKITITQEFDTAEEAVAFIGRAAGATVLDPARDAEPHCALPSQTPGPNPVKPPRKPRADAGKPRGAYKPREDARQAEGAEHTNAKPEGAAKPSDTSAIATSEPATAPSAAAPAAAPSGAAPAAPAPLTIDDLRALMSKLNAVPNKGMTATLGALHAFCVNRISELPADKYDEFAEYLRQKIAG